MRTVFMTDDIACRRWLAIHPGADMNSDYVVQPTELLDVLLKVMPRDGREHSGRGAFMMVENLDRESSRPLEVLARDGAEAFAFFLRNRMNIELRMKYGDYYYTEVILVGTSINDITKCGVILFDNTITHAPAPAIALAA